ncbi:GNAT family protein [Aquimarina algiphila]|uniref:GNAT family N-acetyltransferase n=1 Tax=Aquimarina algiphila TaxID=2047982 RepID=A0A554VHL7_9FLAO|nr:GNAT family protein [Aquimarina algiphila]TSE06972.1 GNAT family N-acetyltransferase [Aquimarina algiphila]
MTEKEIKKYIDRLNNKKVQESIFIRPINETIVIGKVWCEQPKENDSISNSSSYRFFFIKNNLGVYVSAVLDMNSDLHWYVIPEERKKGLLTKALKETILPYIFYEREEQRITVKLEIGEKNYANSKNVALKLGFNSLNETQTEFLLKKSEFDWSFENLNEQNSRIGNERIQVLRKRVNYASQILRKVSDELLMAYEDDNELLELSKEVKSHTWKIENLIWEYEQSE